jgi:hypothetical protein
MNTSHPVRDGWRDGSPAGQCLVCNRAVPSRKARYCSRACQQRAYRLRRDAATTLEEPNLRQDLRRRRTLAAHTIYECPACQERFLGERRCPDCHRFCRALGLGGPCPECDTPILLSDLLDLEVTT